jgi:MFS family permease
MQFLDRGWARLFPNPTFYGWKIVWIGFLCSALSSPGQSFAISLYLEHFIVDLGISRVEISSVYALVTLAAATLLPLIGTWSDRSSARRFLTPTIVLLGVTMLVLSRANDLLLLAGALFALRLLGQGAIGLGTLTATVRWFCVYRGRALAVVALGYAFGEMVFPWLIYGLVEGVGWRASLVAFGAAYILLFAPLMGRVLREPRPEEGFDGIVRSVNGEAPFPRRGTSYTLGEALRTPVFWALMLCLSIPPLVMTAVIFHQVAIFTSHGWDPSLVPPAFMAFAGAAVVMTYATGLLLERIPSRFAVAGGMLLVALALATVAAPLAPTANALLYGTLLGLASGATGAANSMVWPDYFGIEALGAVKGVVNAVRNGATAFGPILAAGLFSLTGSFAPALILFGCASLVAVVIALLLPPPASDVVADVTLEPATSR